MHHLSRLVLNIVLFVAAFVLPVAAAAQSTMWQRAEFSDIRLIAGEREGDMHRVGVEITFDDGWKTYWRSPGDAGFPLEMSAAPAAENVKDVALHWPFPKRFVEEWGLEVFGFKKKFFLPVSVQLKDGSADADGVFDIAYAVCSDICIRVEQQLSLSLPANGEPKAIYLEKLDKALSKVPADNGAHGLSIGAVKLQAEAEGEGVLSVQAMLAEGEFLNPDLFIEGPVGLRFPIAKTERSADGKTVTFLIPYEYNLPAKTLVGGELVGTLVHGDKAVEHEFTVGKLGEEVASAAPAPATGGETGPTPTHMPSSTEAPGSLFTILLFALIGGLILNVMSCVLPVLSLKLVGVVKYGGGDTREVRISFIATVVGILLFFAALASITVSAKEAGEAVGWGFHFQSPVFLTFLTVVILLFAFNLFGMFEVQLPDWMNTHIYESGDKQHRHHAVGDMMTGLFAALMATPCSAPFLGTAVGFALSRGAAEIWMVFMALGVGLALPYILAAMYPKAVTYLPKPGAWMNRVKHIMGLLLLAAGVWLLWVILQQTNLTIMLFVTGVSLLLGVFLRLRMRMEKLRTPYAPLFIVALVFALSSMFPNLVMTPEKQAEMEAEKNKHWVAFDEAAIPALLAEGKVVFVDVTADWCITCKTNKLLVLERANVREALSANDVVAMKADLTLPDPKIRAFLEKHERYGIPFNVVFGPSAKEGIELDVLLSKSEVLDALKAAK